MTVSEQIRVLCALSNVTYSELARRSKISKQSISNKLKSGYFTIEELKIIGIALDCEFVEYFVLPNGDKIV